MLTYELEHDLDNELEYEFEDDDYESEYESEEFLATLLPAVAPIAMKALGGLFRESEFEFEQDDDDEFEDEFEYEADLETLPVSSDEALMRKLATMAVKSESEAEAEAFLGAIAGLAAKALPAIASAAPTLIKGVSRLGRSLLRNRNSRNLVKAIPDIVMGTARDLARRKARSRPVSSRSAMRSLARHTARTFRSPRRTSRALKRSRYPRYSYAYRRPMRRRRRYAY